MSNMKIIGLTGPSGAGKGFCYGFFTKYEVPCIDTDDIYHKLLIPPSACVDELVENFGKVVLNDFGEIKRKILAEIVFSDQSGEKLQLLNSITHKYVLKKTKELVEDYRKQKKSAVVVDAPLLFEANFDKFCDFSIAVISDCSTRVKRIMERDSITEEAALMRIRSQKCDDFYTSRADYTVINDKDCASLEKQLKNIFINENLTMRKE